MCLCTSRDKVGRRVFLRARLHVRCGLIVGQNQVGAARADAGVEAFNNAKVLVGLFIRVKLK